MRGAIWALFNDVVQRIITLNKWDQRRHLLGRLRALGLPAGSRALDFGCGTGLFARTFRRAGLRYVGYDIDPRLVSYARRLYPDCTFLADLPEVKRHGPFEVIVANCCFHHIADDALAIELARLKGLLADGGTFLMIDLLLQLDDPSFLLRQFNKLERGSFIRREEDYRRLVGSHFAIKRDARERFHVFSLKGNPLYGDVVVLECGKWRERPR